MMDDEVEVLGEKSVEKAVDKALGKSIDGVGAFFSSICMPAAEEFGLLLKDKVAIYRLKNLEEVANKTQKVLEHQNIQPSGDSNPRVIKEIIEESSWCDDDKLQNMWAGLIAVSSTLSNESDDSLLYIEQLKKLTPYQARIIDSVYGDPRCCSVPNAGQRPKDVKFLPQVHVVFTIPELLKLFPGDLSKFVPISAQTHESILLDTQNHHIAISRFKPQFDSLVTMGLMYDIKRFDRNGVGKVDFVPTYQGLDFYMRCLGYNVYPTEAFLLTLQHWCKLKGIDPFSELKT